MEKVTIDQSVFQNLLENIPGMLYRCRFEPSWPILYVSKGSLELTGYYPEELIQSKVDFASLIHPADRDWVWEHFTLQLSKRENCNCEYRILTREGKSKWVQEVASGVFDDTGALLYIEGYIIDISEKKEHHKIISKLESQVDIINTNERRLRALLNAIPDSLIRITSEGGCFVYSLDNTGSMAADQEGQLTAFFPEDIAQQFLAAARKAIRTAQRLSFEYQLNDGQEIRYFEARMAKSGDEEVVAIIRDVSERLRSKQDTDRTARFYQEIINNSNTEIAVFDEDRRYRYVSKMGISNENVRNWIIGKNDFEYCKERNKPLILAEKRARMFDLVKEMQRPADWIEEVEDPEGEFRYFVRNLSPFKFEGEEFFLGHSTEITALKVVQNELQRREQLFSCSQEIAKIGYWVSYDKGSSFEWSQSFYKILELEGQLHASLTSYLLLVHPEDRECVSDHFHNLIQNGASSTIEYRIITPGGNVKHLREQAQTEAGQGNSGDYTFGVIQDVTAFRLSQAALGKRESHFRAIAESSPGLIIEVDRQMTIRYINTLRVRTPEEVIGLPVFFFTHPAFREPFREKLEACFDTGEVQNLQIIGEGPGTRNEWYEVTIGPVKDGGKDIETLVLLAQNVTLNKKNEKERERLIQEINHKYNELMQFNYIVSHNLRAPVANILGMTYLLNIGLPEEETKSILEDLVKSAESIDTLIKDLNNILAARSPLNEKKENFYLRDVLDSILHDLESQIFMSAAEIHIESHDNWEVTSIRSYIQSVLHHLVSNAIKYKHPDRRPEIRISYSVSQEDIHIDISDNGIGIDLDLYKDEVFGLYKRFTNTVAGKGLGLHMVKAQIESLGGTIEIESSIDRGTAFRIRLAQG